MKVPFDYPFLYRILYKFAWNWVTPLEIDKAPQTHHRWKGLI